jgi:hypothetical protein|tara:strand:- start:383 stop:562 length:180 start_codon:yes stop_codon:yes gene_type:complete
MKKIKISINMQGGIIQSINTNNKNIDLKIFDYDDAEITGTIKDLEKKEKIFNKYLKYNL